MSQSTPIIRLPRLFFQRNLCWSSPLLVLPTHALQRKKSLNHSHLLVRQASTKHHFKDRPTKLSKTARRSNKIENEGRSLADVVGDEAWLENVNSCQMEFHSGTNGYEAMLFNVQLINAYEKFVKRRGWQWEMLDFAGQEEGLRFALAGITGPQCYATLRFEAGLHRVAPVEFRNERESRLRTNVTTIRVVVMPELENPEFELSKRDVKEEAMRSSGAGGMNVNSKSTAIRLTHLPTGVSVKCQEERYLEKNRQRAYRRLSALLLQRQIDAVSQTKQQLSMLARSVGKIRTYNPRGKSVTEHRLGLTLNEVLDDYLQGGESFDRIVDAIQEAHLREQIQRSERKEGSDEELWDEG